MPFIKLAFDFLSRWTLAPLLKWLMSDADEFAIFEYDKTSIWHPKQADFNDFSECTTRALELIENHCPHSYAVVSQQLKYIIGQPKDKKAMAKYNRAMRSSILYWKNLKKYDESTRINFMAGALIHEAYHGKCYDVFGLKAYFENKRMEQICRNREVRFLKYIRGSSEAYADESMNDRIEMLSTTTN